MLQEKGSHHCLQQSILLQKSLLPISNGNLVIISEPRIPQAQGMEDRGNENDRLEEKNCEAFRKDLSRLLYRPRPRLDENIESSLSVIPWTIRLLCRNSAVPSKESDDAKPRTIVFPSPSYLDLRRQQNIKFADEQAAKDKDPSAWKQAIQLVPDHVPSLVAYGKYCLETNKLEQAEKHLRDAISIDGKHAFAHKLLSELDEKRHSRNRHQPYTTSRPHVLNQTSTTTTTSSLKTRESSAYQDALLERQLLASPKDDDNNQHHHQQQQQEDDDDHSDESIDRKQDRKKRRKKRRKHHRKRRHRYYDSSDSDSSGDRRRRERKRRKKKKHHKRSKRDDSTADSG